MKKLVFKQDECRSYKDFYEKLCAALGMDNVDDLDEFENLNYSPDLLSEYLWYKTSFETKLHFVFIGYDYKAIKTKIPYENYMWNLIFKVLDRLVKDHPENRVDYI